MAAAFGGTALGGRKFGRAFGGFPLALRSPGSFRLAAASISGHRVLRLSYDQEGTTHARRTSSQRAHGTCCNSLTTVRE